MRTQIFRRLSVCSAVIALAASVGSAQAQAQGGEFGVAAGVAVPTQDVSDVHTAGPHLLGYAANPISARMQFRGTLSLTQLGANEDAFEDFDRGSLRVVSVDGAIVYSPAGNGRGIYGMGGVGAYVLHRSGGDVEPETHTVPGFSLGVGSNLRIGTVPAFVQARMEVPFSTLGTNSEFAPTTFVPISVGIRFP